MKEENRTQIKHIALCFGNLLEPTAYIVETWKFEKFFPQILVTLAHKFFSQKSFLCVALDYFLSPSAEFFLKRKMLGHRGFHEECTVKLLVHM